MLEPQNGSSPHPLPPHFLLLATGWNPVTDLIVLSLGSKIFSLRQALGCSLDSPSVLLSPEAVWPKACLSGPVTLTCICPRIPSQCLIVSQYLAYLYLYS